MSDVEAKTETVAELEMRIRLVRAKEIRALGLAVEAKAKSLRMCPGEIIEVLALVIARKTAVDAEVVKEEQSYVQ